MEVPAVFVRLNVCTAQIYNKGRNGLCRKLCCKAAAAEADGALCQVLAAGGAVTGYVCNGLSLAQVEALGILRCALVDCNHNDLILVVFVCRNQNIVCGLLRCVNTYIAGTNILRILRHAVAALTDFAVLGHQTIASADVPPGIGIHISHNKTVVNILRNLYSLRIIIGRICITVRNIYFRHPDFLAAAFKLGEIHL